MGEFEALGGQPRVLAEHRLLGRFQEHPHRPGAVGVPGFHEVPGDAHGGCAPVVHQLGGAAVQGEAVLRGDVVDDRGAGHRVAEGALVDESGGVHVVQGPADGLRVEPGQLAQFVDAALFAEHGEGASHLEHGEPVAVQAAQQGESVSLGAGLAGDVPVLDEGV